MEYWNNINITNNTGIILLTDVIDNDFNGITTDWSCPSSSESYTSDGIIKLSNILFNNNNIGSQESYLFDIQFHHVFMTDVTFSDNICQNEALQTDYFADGCIRAIDCAMNFEDCTFIDNDATFIISISRTQSTVDNINSVQMCFDNLNGINNIGNTFLHIYNMSDEDLITMTNSEITSPDLVDNSTKVNINMCQFYNISSSVFKWYSDDNDGNVYLNMNVSNSNFTISVLNAIFGSDLSNDNNYISNRYGED